MLIACCEDRTQWTELGEKHGEEARTPHGRRFVQVQRLPSVGAHDIELIHGVGGRGADVAAGEDAVEDGRTDGRTDGSLLAVITVEPCGAGRAELGFQAQMAVFEWRAMATEA